MNPFLHVSLMRVAIPGLLLLGIASTAHAQSDDRRARWEAMPEERREEMRRRFEEFHRLPPEEQRRIRGRAERLAQLRERLRENLPPDLRERWGTLPPPERARMNRGFLEGHLGEVATFLREILPREEQERLRGLPPREREKMLRRILERILAERVERSLAQPPPWISAEEANLLRDLPPREKFREMARLHKERFVREVEGDSQLLSKISPEAWRRMKELPPPRFLPRYFLWRRGLERGFGPPHPPDGRFRERRP